MCWLDDQFLVSGSKDAKMALWRINEDVTDTLDGNGELTCPTYARVSALAVKECRAAQKIRSLCFNRDYKEIAVISLNGYIHIFNAETFSQKLSRKLPNCQDNVCIASQPQGLYAVGCRSYTLLLDPRTLQVRVEPVGGINRLCWLVNAPGTLVYYSSSLWLRLCGRLPQDTVDVVFGRPVSRKTYLPLERGWVC